MNETIDLLIQRLLLESSNLLVIDANKPVSIPDEESYFENLEMEEDDTLHEKIFLEYLTKKAALDNKQPLIGGPLLELQGIIEASPNLEISYTICEPDLRTLKDFCKRILIRQVINRTCVTLFVDAIAIDKLDQARINHIGIILRKKIEQILNGDEVSPEETADNLSKKKKKSKKKRALKTCVQFDVVVVGSGVLNNITTHNSYQKKLKQLKQRSRKSCVIIQGFLLDSSNNQVWSTNTITGWRQRRYWRYALNHINQSAKEIRSQLLNQKPKQLSAIIVGAIATIVAFFIKTLIAMRFGAEGGVLIICDLIISSIAIQGFNSFQRLNIFASAHAKWALISYLFISALIVLALTWPPNVSFIIYFGMTGFLIYTINMYAALMAEMD